MKRLMGLFVLLFCGAVPAAAQPFVFTDRAADFFNDSTVREIRLYFADPNWNNVMVTNHGTAADPFIPCRFKYGNVDLPRVGRRYKGNASFRRNLNKRPIKLDFNEFDPAGNFLGLTKLNLHTNDLQPDFMREKLYTDFMRKYVPAVRMVHVRVYINDNYHGLYCAMEQPDKQLYEARYGRNENGNLWEGGGAGGTPDLAYRGNADPATYRAGYELETNLTANDYSQLAEFINVLNNTPPADLPARLEPIADVEALLHWLALNNLFVNLDSYINAPGEYYIYDRSRDGRIVLTQWDHNESFGATGDGTPNLANPFIFDPFWLPNATANRPLATRLWAVPEYRRYYLRAFARYLREGFNPADFSARITQLAGLIRPDVIADPNKNTSNAQFELAQNEQTTATATGGLRIWGANQFVRERHNFLRGYLNNLAAPADVRLNELVAVNNGIYKDANGDADPWPQRHCRSRWAAFRSRSPTGTMSRAPRRCFSLRRDR
ncbi:MAG: CotH kinase family protein [Blastocatellia bacterium]